MSHDAKSTAFDMADAPAGVAVDVRPTRVAANDLAAADERVPRLRVAYLTNQYPKVSHSFIRREIVELERQGVEVHRFAIRGWDADLVDPADIAELAHTRFVLRKGLLPVLAAAAGQCLKNPRAFVSALRAAVAMSFRSERSLPYHLVYLAQACLVLKWLRESRAEHLHAHFSTNPAEVATLVRLLGDPPYSFTSHGPEENDRGAFLSLDRKVRHASFVAAISSHTKSQILRRIDPVDWGKVRVVRCGLDREFYRRSADPVPDCAKFVCIARLDPEKGHVVLLEAMARVHARHPRCELVLAGDGPMRPQLEKQIRLLNLSQCVRITGWISSAAVREEILSSRALVLPSFQEGLPVVIMEAMSLKRPVIATSISGIPELVRAGDCGWLVPAGSEDDLASAMEACLETPIGDLRRMGEVAHGRVTSFHDIGREAAKLSALFRTGPEEAPAWTA